MLSILSLEFYLVAGGDELFLETGMFGPVKLEDGLDRPLGYDENDAPSSQSTTPDFSPRDLTADFSHSPTDNCRGGSSALFPKKALSVCKEPSPRDNLSALSQYPFHANARPQESPSSFRSTESPLDRSPPPASSGSVISPKGSYKHEIVASNQPRSADTPSPHTPGVNRVKTVCLLADGMTPFSIHVDALMTSQSRRSWLALKMRLCITSVDDIRSPSTLHGFVGSVCLSSTWVNSAKCITKAYVGNVCVSEEVGSLGLSNIEVGQVTAILPDSSLTRCRWLDACECRVFMCKPDALTSL
jgi:hypothetical protein